MMVFESKKVRRLVVRVERGEDVVSSIEALAREQQIRAAWVRGLGSLAWVELDRHDQDRRAPEPPQRFETPCDILALEGNVSMSGTTPRALLHVTLARRTDNGVDVIGGRMRAGEAFACELTIEVFEDLTLARTRDEDTGLSSWTDRSAPRAAPPPARVHEEPEDDDEEVEEEVPAERPTGGVSWADVAAVSAAPPVAVERPRRARPPSEPPASGFRPPAIPDKRRASDDELFEDHVPQKGDFIEHRQFGLCKIDREDEEGGLVIRLPSGVRKTIKLDFMEVGAPRHEGTRTIYPVRPKRR